MSGKKAKKRKLSAKSGTGGNPDTYVYIMFSVCVVYFSMTDQMLKAIDERF